jgi:hypothetical protein
VTSACNRQEIFENPPTDLQEADLVGIWEAHYDGPGTGVDRLVIRADGTFRQEYNSLEALYFESPWNKWWVERFEDGRIYVHLRGARFYNQGVRIGEDEGHKTFYDPVSDVYVEVGRELVLSVRAASDSPGGLVLKHLRFGGEGIYSDEFYRVGDEP